MCVSVTGSCDCDPGWGGVSCAQSDCNTATCVHGTCVLSGADIFTCQCDASLWTGAYCDIAVCSDGCSPEHGTCTDAPDTCTCAPGWIGPLCRIPNSWLREMGMWVDANNRFLFIFTTLMGLVAVSVAGVAANVLQARSASGGARAKQRGAQELAPLLPPAAGGSLSYSSTPRANGAPVAAGKSGRGGSSTSSLRSYGTLAPATGTAALSLPPSQSMYSSWTDPSDLAVAGAYRGRVSYVTPGAASPTAGNEMW